MRLQAAFLAVGILVIGAALFGDDSYHFKLNTTPQTILSSRGSGGVVNHPGDTHLMTLGDVPTYGDCLKKTIENLIRIIGDGKFIKAKSVIEKNPLIKSLEISLTIENEYLSQRTKTCSGFNNISLTVNVETKEGSGFSKKSLDLEINSKSEQLIDTINSAASAASTEATKSKDRLIPLRDSIKLPESGAIK